MPVPIEPTTPLVRSRPSRPLVASPDDGGRRRLTYGSRSPSREGYGIVSAAGLNAWRRGPKRVSASTATASHSDTTKRKGLGMGLEGTPGRRKFRRTSKVGLIPNTQTLFPERRYAKAEGGEQRKMGLQSTPKIARQQSRSNVDETRSSELSSDLPSSVASASTNDQADQPSLDIGADTIEGVGEDVFGLTISIDADGTMRGIHPSLSPGSSGAVYDDDNCPRGRFRDHMDTTPRRKCPYRNCKPDRGPRCYFCVEGFGGEAYSSDQGPWCTCDELAFGVCNVCSGVNDTPPEKCAPYRRREQIRAAEDFNPAIPNLFPPYSEAADDVERERCELDYWAREAPVAENSASECLRTEYWETTVPIHDNTGHTNLTLASDTIDEFDYDDEFVTMLENLESIDHSILLNDISAPSTAGRMDSEASIVVRKRISRDKIVNRPKTPGRPSSARPRDSVTRSASKEDESVETNRGINLSKLGLQQEADVQAEVEHATENHSNLATRDAHAEPPPSHVPDSNAAEQVGQRDVPIPANVHDMGYNDTSVEPADRVLDNLEIVLPDDVTSFENVEDSPTPHPQIGGDDLFGFRKAEKLIKAERPRRYRATSELETPPRIDATRQHTASSSPSSLSSSAGQSESTSITTPRAAATQPSESHEGPRDWRGAWKGHGRTSKRHLHRGAEVGDSSADSHDTAPGKIFKEPHYHAVSEAARQKRIEHYADLEANYSLHVELGYF